MLDERHTRLFLLQGSTAIWDAGACCFLLSLNFQRQILPHCKEGIFYFSLSLVRCLSNNGLVWNDFAWLIFYSFPGFYQQNIFVWKFIFMSPKDVGLKAVEIEIHSVSRKKLDSIHPSSVVSLRPDFRWQRSLSVSLKNISSQVISADLPWNFRDVHINLVRKWRRAKKSSREPWNGNFLFSWLIQTEFILIYFFLIGPKRIQASPLEMKFPIFHSKFPWAKFPPWRFARTPRAWVVLSQLS